LSDKYFLSGVGGEKIKENSLQKTLFDAGT